MRTHLECRATPTTRTTQRTSRALKTAIVIGHLNCSIFSPIPMAPARLMPLKGFRISKLRFTAMLVFCFMPFSATNSRPSIVLLLTGASNSSPRAVNCGCIFFFKVASIVSVCKEYDIDGYKRLRINVLHYIVKLYLNSIWRASTHQAHPLKGEVY